MANNIIDPQQNENIQEVIEKIDELEKKIDEANEHVISVQVELKGH